MKTGATVRASVAIFVSAAFFWTLLLSVSPQLHARIHSDANRVEHNCAVTMIASGNYDHAAHPPLVSAPVPAIQFSKIPALTPQWVGSPVSWRMHFRACAARAPLSTQLSRVLAER